MAQFGDVCAFNYDVSPLGREMARQILQRLEPFDVRGFRKTRVGRDQDGGYVMLDDFAGIAAAYSLGISDETSWDRAIAARDIPVFQYDHTVEGVVDPHPLFRFHRIGIAAERSGEQFETLADLMDRNEHAASRDLILKCDIEGDEWMVLAALDPRRLQGFRQIVVEFHGFRDLYQPVLAQLAALAVGNLTAGHRVVHVHGNNYAPYTIVGGIPVPTVLEITLVRKDDKSFVRPSRPFPTPLDRPNHPQRADYSLGLFRF